MNLHQRTRFRNCAVRIVSRESLEGVQFWRIKLQIDESLKWSVVVNCKRKKSHSKLNDTVKIEQGLFLLKAAARLGHCKAIYAFCDYLMSYTLIDTGLVESWIEIYLSINPCMRKELEMLGR